MDDACEPSSMWKLPRPRKYFGLNNGVLGYHFDRAGRRFPMTLLQTQNYERWGGGSSRNSQKRAPLPRRVSRRLRRDPTTTMTRRRPQQGSARKQAQQRKRLFKTEMALLRFQKKNLAQHTARHGGVPCDPSKDFKGMTRRAAYNALQWLQQNPQRMQKIDPQLREKLLASQACHQTW